MNNDKTKALTTLILTIFFGWFGIYRLLKGQTGLFVLWLLTCGLFGAGWIVDIIFAIIDYMDVEKRTAIKSKNKNNYPQTIAAVKNNQQKNEVQKQIPQQSIFDETIDRPQNRMNDEVMQINLENAKELDTDLVEAGYFRGCCGECAKYRKRWFSISGNDKRFPKMPVDYGCTCSGIDFSPVIYGISEPTYADEIDDIIEFSNRPFVDDRDDEEIKLYQYDRDRHIFEEVRERDRLLFEKMQKEIPDFPFKSFNSYRRTSKDKIKQYAETAKKYGFNILYSEEEEAAIARYLLNKKELGL